MPTRTSYLQGTPNWVDLQSTDQEGAKAFYGDLLGWTFDDQPIPDGGVYSMALKGDGVVAAIGGQQPDMAAQNMPSIWNTYIAVDDADAAAVRVDAAGGKILMPTFDVMDVGRMVFIADPTGAPVALWQAYTNIGATLVNEPGAVSWNELQTDDVQAAANFYSAVLGITTEAQPGEMPYLTFKVDDRDVAGITVAQAPGTPPSWQVYFAVEDTAATIAKAEKLGGTTIAGPIDTPFGAMAALRDPQGGFFNVIAAPAT
jgi:predicted enzyme related to lactoylglutathione lyase